MGLVVLVGLALSGVTYPWTNASTLANDVVSIEVPFGVASAGVSVGTNATNASVVLPRALSLSTTNALYLNNTNASGEYWAKISAFSSSGALTRISVMNVGINNGTQTSQVAVVAGALTQSTGTYVRLPPGSTNTIYVSQLMLNLGGTDPTFGLEVWIADEQNATSYTKTRMSLQLD